MSIERREHTRFDVQKPAFAFLGFGHSIAGQILNISKGGLAFRYVASRNRTNELSELDITLIDRSFQSNVMKFKPIWDSEIPRGYAFGEVTMRHCGVTFRNLTAENKFDLGYFIENHATIFTKI
jgi:hypothetical protein